MSDPFGLLGLTPGATADAVREARRDLAKQHHPDLGGDPDKMQAINAAAGAALHALAQQADPEPAEQTDTQTDTQNDTAAGTSRDMPSFTVEALPVETFEALLVVTGWVGKVLDDDPPYRLDTHLYQPGECWCRLELVPDAGASTVSLTIASYGEQPLPAIEAVRDMWVAQLNQYDWE